MLALTPGGGYRNAGGNHTTLGHEFTSAAFRKLQRAILDGAIRALEELPLAERDQTSLTVAIDSRDLPEVRARIRAFRRELNDFLSARKKYDRVCQLSISFYPVTSLPKGKK